MGNWKTVPVEPTFESAKAMMRELPDGDTAGGLILCKAMYRAAIATAPDEQVWCPGCECWTPPVHHCAAPESELARLAMEIATRDSVAILEREGTWTTDENGNDWFDANDMEPGYGGPEARHFLDLCGLLERHPDNPDWVRVKEAEG